MHPAVGGPGYLRAAARVLDPTWAGTARAEGGFAEVSRSTEGPGDLGCVRLLNELLRSQDWAGGAEALAEPILLFRGRSGLFARA
mmetsp:Transcript_9110/g.26259  ORF Transcript_9110/g.26259 Transcript_9110/m.26259 type:complete len:85 (-) Transcript_9110:493-747(-)